MICPSQRDRYELSQTTITNDYKIFFHEWPADAFERILASGTIGSFEQKCPLVIINELLDLCDQEGITAVFSSDDYPGSIYTSIVADIKKFKAPCPVAVLRCQHKYHSRKDQLRIVPTAVPHFNFLDAIDQIDTIKMPFPLFVKPVKSYFSYLAGTVTDSHALQKVFLQKKVPAPFLNQFNWFLQKFGFEPNAHALLAETILEGTQVTIEGFVNDGRCTILGVTDSIMYPGTISFARFEYPSSLPESVQKRMAIIAEHIMLGIHFNNSFFNIEMMYNAKTDQIFIIEINPRMCAQFADLYEKVDGINSFRTVLDIATGNQPTTAYRKGNFNIAASCVMRIFENKRVLKIPTQDHIDQVKKLFPEARIYICTQEGSLLSDQLQDGNSYRYCLVHVGAKNRKELLEKFEIAQKLLSFEFQNI